MDVLDLNFCLDFDCLIRSLLFFDVVSSMDSVCFPKRFTMFFLGFSSTGLACFVPFEIFLFDDWMCLLSSGISLTDGDNILTLERYTSVVILGLSSGVGISVLFLSSSYEKPYLLLFCYDIASDCFFSFS